MHTIIVNKATGDLSTVADQQQMEANVFLTSPAHFNCYPGEVDAATLDWLAQHWQRMIVIGPGLPLTSVSEVIDPTFAYLLITPIVAEGRTTGTFQITPVHLPQAVLFGWAKIRAQGRLDAQFERAKGGRFQSAATGNTRFYDGKDFLLFALAFTLRGASGPFACALSEAAPWGVEMHTPAQMQAVGDDYAAWYQGLQAHYYDRQADIATAQSIEALEAIAW